MGWFSDLGTAAFYLNIRQLLFLFDVQSNVSSMKVSDILFSQCEDVPGFLNYSDFSVTNSKFTFSKIAGFNLNDIPQMIEQIAINHRELM